MDVVELERAIFNAKTTTQQQQPSANFSWGADSLCIAGVEAGRHNVVWPGQMWHVLELTAL